MVDRVLPQRLNWVQMYEETDDAGFVCRRCEISRPTFREWFRRCRNQVIEVLERLTKKPESSPDQIVFQEQQSWVLALRSKSKLGARWIQKRAAAAI